MHADELLDMGRSVDCVSSSATLVVWFRGCLSLRRHVIVAETASNYGRIGCNVIGFVPVLDPGEWI